VRCELSVEYALNSESKGIGVQRGGQLAPNCCHVHPLNPNETFNCQVELGVIIDSSSGWDNNQFWLRQGGDS